MVLHDFLRLVVEGLDFSNIPVIILQADHYPAAFFARLIALLKTNTACVSVDTQIASLVGIKAQLETSFLGNRMLYWVKNVHELDVATKKSWLAYTRTYHGPHTILFFKKAVEAENEQALIVELPELCDATLYKLLFSYFYQGSKLESSFVSALFEHNQKITLDEAGTLMGYQTVVGRKSDLFFKRWLSRLVVPEKSLFTLSQHLFAKQPRLFLQCWHSLKSDFPQEFWVAYWSEQIWQATLFIARARTHGFDAAKKSAYRLPFSFINKDWRGYSQESLTQAHQFLYKLDYNLKNSAGTHGIELWYHKFLKR